MAGLFSFEGIVLGASSRLGLFVESPTSWAFAKKAGPENAGVRPYAVARASKKPDRKPVGLFLMVAGTGFEPVTFRL